MVIIIIIIIDIIVIFIINIVVIAIIIVAKDANFATSSWLHKLLIHRWESSFYIKSAQVRVVIWLLWTHVANLALAKKVVEIYEFVIRIIYPRGRWVLVTVNCQYIPCLPFNSLYLSFHHSSDPWAFFWLTFSAFNSDLKEFLVFLRSSVLIALFLFWKGSFMVLACMPRFPSTCGLLPYSQIWISLIWWIYWPFLLISSTYRTLHFLIYPCKI